MNTTPKKQANDEAPSMDEVLRRMLSTPPTPKVKARPEQQPTNEKPAK